jgi:glyoxylase-like metal-dependent hydrolase (beta-lactamase superfamily II)
VRRALLLTIALLGCRLTVPMSADRAEHARFSSTSRHNASLQIVALRMGTQKAPGCAPAGEASCFSCKELVHAAFVVKHPRATFLIDAGLSARSRDDLARFSIVDRAVFEYAEEGSLGQLLQSIDAAPDFVIVTHAHWDHTGGLVDLRSPRVMLGPGEAEFVKAFPKNKPPTVMPDHLASARLESFAWDGGAIENFEQSHDLFGDGSVTLVPLPGHTPGSIGVLLDSVRGQRLLFVGDAAWSIRGVELPSHKSAPLSDLADHDPKTLSDTLWRLHHLHEHDPSLLIVPTHDGEAFRAVAALSPVAPAGGRVYD